MWAMLHVGVELLSFSRRDLQKLYEGNNTYFKKERLILFIYKMNLMAFLGYQKCTYTGTLDACSYIKGRLSNTLDTTIIPDGTKAKLVVSWE